MHAHSLCTSTFVHTKWRMLAQWYRKVIELYRISRNFQTQLTITRTFIPSPRPTPLQHIQKLTFICFHPFFLSLHFVEFNRWGRGEGGGGGGSVEGESNRFQPVFVWSPYKPVYPWDRVEKAIMTFCSRRFYAVCGLLLWSPPRLPAVPTWPLFR